MKYSCGTQGIRTFYIGTYSVLLRFTRFAGKAKPLLLFRFSRFAGGFSVLAAGRLHALLC